MSSECYWIWNIIFNKKKSDDSFLTSCDISKVKFKTQKLKISFQLNIKIWVSKYFILFLECYKINYFMSNWEIWIKWD